MDFDFYSTIQFFYVLYVNYAAKSFSGLSGLGIHSRPKDSADNHKTPEGILYLDSSFPTNIQLVLLRG